VPPPVSLQWPDAVRPHLNEASFAAWFEHAPPDVRHQCIQDEELGRLVGMLTLAGNRPRDLSIEICNVWLTPAFRKSSTTAGGATRPPHAQIAVYLTLCSLFKSNYRRVTMHVSTINIAGRKFAEACGFQLEGIHRKHRIAHGANQDTCVYALLNSDWLQVKFAWEKRVGMRALPLAEPERLAPTATAGSAASTHGASAASAGTAGASAGGGSVRKRPITHIFDKCSESRPTWADKGSPLPNTHREKGRQG
jgi:RimJ/RimL family protein N-acetyltransferase